MIVRCTDQGQKHWALLGLAVQLARGLGLHCATTTNTFNPLRREMRLRLWQVLRNLEFRAALDWGVDPIIKLDSYDTPNPTNLNDDDLTEDTIVLPQPRVGMTDSSFGPVADQGIALAARLQYLESSQIHVHSNIWAYRLALVEEYEKNMYTQYLSHCDLKIPMQWMMTYVAHALSRFCHLLVVRPMSRLGENKHILPTMSSQEVYDRAVESLRAEELFYQTPLVKGFHWCTWNQWYCLAVALVEICAMPSLCRENGAWAVLEQAYKRQSTSIAETSRGRLWKPMRKLLKRVQNLREQQLMFIDVADTSTVMVTHEVGNFFAPITAATVVGSETPVADTFLNLQSGLSGSLAQIDTSMAFWDDFLVDMKNLSPSEIQAWYS